MSSLLVEDLSCGILFLKMLGLEILDIHTKDIHIVNNQLAFQEFVVIGTLVQVHIYTYIGFESDV